MAANTDRAVLKEAVDNILIKLNNYLAVNDLKQRYVLSWVKGEKEIVNNTTKQPISNYYSLSLDVVEEDGNKVGVYGAHYPISAGTSIVRVFEAEVQAYKDLLTHSIGSLISIQHSMYFLLRIIEEQEFNDNLKAKIEE